MAEECFSVFVYYKKGPSGVNWPSWGAGEFVKACERRNNKEFHEKKELESFLCDLRKQGWELYLCRPAVGDRLYRQEIICERS